MHRRLALALPLLCLAPLALPAGIARGAEPLPGAASPVGEWRTIDDNTHAPRAIVRITEEGGALYGTVEKSLIANPPHKTCDQCTDDRKDQPIIGMQIIRGLKPDGSEWDGGTILDPESGKTYKCKVRVEDNGQKLAVRGFIGISLFGRTQTWERVS